MIRHQNQAKEGIAAISSGYPGVVDEIDKVEHRRRGAPRGDVTYSRYARRDLRASAKLYANPHRDRSGRVANGDRDDEISG
jgi:hypothetical protein